MFARTAIIVLLIINNVLSEYVTVNSSAGNIRGIQSETLSMYLGIPYGVINEEKPFLPATSQPAFQLTFEATRNPPVCPQYKHNTVEGDIHCLNLNIYTPNNIKPIHSLPVMVYLHGGSFVEGDGNLNSFGPEFLLKFNIILVTVNYRLGPYGFLCLNESIYSNVGLKDQILALKWVRNNIHGFGGDINNVLLFGHSAGGVSTDLLLYNEKLFNKVIIQSGVGICPVILGDVDYNLIEKISKKLNYNGNFNNISRVIDFLSTVNVKRLIEVSRNEVFRPCIDNTVIDISPNLNNLKDIKIIIGNTNKDAYTFYKNLPFHLKADLTKNFETVTNKMAEYVRKYYFNGNFDDDVVEYGTDYVFNYAIERAMRLYLENGATVYRYVFSYDGNRNFCKVKRGINVSGAVHEDELGYIFKMDLFNGTTDKDREIIDAMTSMWTNFAKYGDPTPNVSNNIKWAPITDGAKPYLHINSPLEIRHDAYSERIVFWDMFYQLFGNYAKGFDYGDIETVCGNKV